MQIYDPISDTWTRGPPPTHKAGAACATAVGNVIYYCGGLKDGNQDSGPVVATCA